MYTRTHTRIHKGGAVRVFLPADSYPSPPPTTTAEIRSSPPSASGGEYAALSEVMTGPTYESSQLVPELLLSGKVV